MSLTEPMWLMYPVIALALLTLLFAWSVRWWLLAFPVSELNYSYEPKYRARPVDRLTNYHQVFNMAHAASATSATAVVWTERP